MSDEATDLTMKMVARADAGDLPADAPLRVLAAEFDAAAKEYFSDPQICTVQKFMGCWARARRAWCDVSGEDLV